MNTQLILAALKKAGRATNFLLNIFIGGYSYRKLKRRALYPTLPDFSEVEEIKINSHLLEKEKHKFYSLLSRLKKQGLVEKERKENKIYWKITSLGEKRLEKMKNVFHFPKLTHRREKDNGINIVVFDIPEKKKSTRNWLRENLIALGFQMLQKSVWMGKNKLPEEFLKSLAELGLMDYVHIFKITKTGTIKK